MLYNSTFTVASKEQNWQIPPNSPQFPPPSPLLISLKSHPARPCLSRFKSTLSYSMYSNH